MKPHYFGSLSALGLLSLSTFAAAAPSSKTDVKVCVRIEEKSWARDGSRSDAPAPQPPSTPSAVPSPGTPPNSVPVSSDAVKQVRSALANFGDVGPALPPPAVAIEPSEGPQAPPATLPPPQMVRAADTDSFAVDPKRYLKRLIEYEVTHEPGFESVEKGCSQTLSVELYPVRDGWTGFARYSGTEREEKVDVVHFDELDVFAERVATALLRDHAISETLTRKTVLRADSEIEMRRIQTRPHFLLAMGGDGRIGMIPTAPDDTHRAEDKLRLDNALLCAIGARNKFRAWALDATARLDVGTQQTAQRHNQGGGQADYSVGFGFGLGFLAYAYPDAVNTLYYGGGGSFMVHRYQTLGAALPDGTLPATSGLWGGGLDVDLTLGYEFMRASTLHFFVDATASAPAYVFKSENDQAQINSYIPSAKFRLGLLF